MYILLVLLSGIYMCTLKQKAEHYQFFWCFSLCWWVALCRTHFFVWIPLISIILRHICIAVCSHRPLLTSRVCCIGLLHPSLVMKLAWHLANLHFGGVLVMIWIPWLILCMHIMLLVKDTWFMCSGEKLEFCTLLWGLSRRHCWLRVRVFVCFLYLLAISCSVY